MGVAYKPAKLPDPAMIMASMPDGVPPVSSPAPSSFRHHAKRPDYRPSDPYPGVVPFLMGMALFD